MDEIVDLLWRRDERALELLDRQHSGCCRKILAGFLQSPQDREEAMDDILVKVWNAIPPARPKNLKAYLAKTARNTALHYLERDQAQKRDGITVALDELESCIPDAAAGRDADALHLKTLLNGFVRSLHGNERSFFLRRYYFGESVGEIAAVCGCTENRVSVTLLRTRRKLRDRLEKEDVSV